jgi:hypothetical protein
LGRERRLLARSRVRAVAAGPSRFVVSNRLPVFVDCAADLLEVLT